MALGLLLPRASFADSLNGPILTYRGFTVDLSEAKDAPNLKAIEASLKHQIDIVADCGAKPAILDFFKSQVIFVRPGQGDGGGHFSAGSTGVSVDVAVDAPEKPVVLHELLHAYHYRVLPQGHDNPDLLKFYDRAREGDFYPPDSYVLKNVQEFFAVTASLYLWGNVDRPRTIARRSARSRPSITNGSAIFSESRRIDSPAHPPCLCGFARVLGMQLMQCLDKRNRFARSGK